jgi:hypothetical protein
MSDVDTPAGAVVVVVIEGDIVERAGNLSGKFVWRGTNQRRAK